jgi:hypothetical protein
MSDDLAQRVEDLEQRVFALEMVLKGGAPPAAPGAKPLSIREFVLSKKPTTKVDTAMVIGFHLEKFSGTSPFNLDDLAKGFAQAKEPLPANPSDLLYQNVRRGFLMESAEKKGGSKAWVITNSGERYVENGLEEP